MGILGLRRKREFRHAGRIGVDQLLFARVPDFQHLVIGQTADQAGMDQAGPGHAGHMARFREHALEVPDRLLGFGEMLGQEAAAVLLREEAVEAPEAVLEGADVEEVDDDQIARLRALDPDGTRQEMHMRQVDVADIGRVVVVLDLAAGPVDRFDDEVVAGRDPFDHRNIGMPAVMNLVVVERGAVDIDLDDGIGHVSSP